MPASGRVVVRLSPDRAAQANEMASFVAERLREAIAARGRAVLAVSGGRSPVPFFECLRDQALEWSAVTLLLVDERVVPAGHPDSNTALVQRHLRQGAAAAAHWVPLLDPAWGDAHAPSDRQGVAPAAEVAGASPLPLARGQKGAGARSDVVIAEQSPADLSEQALTALARWADARVAAEATDLDVVAVLGMGEDGHTASLFPDDPRRNAWRHSPRHVEWARPGGAPHARLTLTLPRLQAARTLVLGLQGEAKRAVFERACREPTTDLPLSLLLVPSAGPMQVWLAP